MQIDKIEFHALITYYMTKQGLKGLNELSAFTLISYKTLLKYWKDPEKFPLGEVGRILDSLRIPKEEFMEKVLIEKTGGMRNEAEEDIKASMHCSNRGSSHRSRSNHSRNSLVNLAGIRPGELSRLRN